MDARDIFESLGTLPVMMNTYFTGPTVEIQGPDPIEMPYAPVLDFRSLPGATKIASRCTKLYHQEETDANQTWISDGDTQSLSAFLGADGGSGPVSQCVFLRPRRRELQ